jgi:hypothetical protein
MRHATRSQDATSAADAARAAFMAALAQRLGMPRALAAGLAGDSVFAPPDSFPLRLAWSDDALAASPFLLLPFAFEEFDDEGALRVSALQTVLLMEAALFFGPSPEGLLQLGSGAWIADPVGAADCVREINRVACWLMTQLVAKP